MDRRAQDISVVLLSPLLTWNNFIPSIVVNTYIYYKVLDKNSHPFPNFNICTDEVWESIDNFIRYFTGHVITYPGLDLS